MQLQLLYSPSSCSVVPYIALIEAGAEFTLRAVNFRQGEHLSKEYLLLNPKHQVPVLIIDGEPLTENVAIQLWIARHFPAARLLPDHVADEYRAIALMAWCASGIHPYLTPNLLPQRIATCPVPRRACVAARIRCCMNAIRSPNNNSPAASGSSSISPCRMLIFFVPPPRHAVQGGHVGVSKLSGAF